VYEKENRDLRHTIARIISLAKAQMDKPFDALQKWVAGPGGADR
jgi:hypothetical protein